MELYRSGKPLKFHQFVDLFEYQCQFIDQQSSIHELWFLITRQKSLEK